MQKSNLRNWKKKPTLDYTQMSPFHASMIKKKKNPNFKGVYKQTYSSFIIKMLDETPINFNKTIKKISATAYKNLFKKNTNYRPFNTNYSPAKKDNMSSFDKIFNKIEKKIINKNENLRENRNKSFNDRNQILHLNNKSSHNLENPNQSLFKDFHKRLKEKEKDKFRLIKNSYNNLKKKRLNALYGYDSNFIKSKNHLLKTKETVELGKYQNEVLKVSQRNLSRDYMIKLFAELQFIRRDADLVKPLPPINYRALVTHCFKEDNKKKQDISVDNKGFKKMDEYEKELYMIKKNNTFKREKTKRNKRMYKIYEILPEYVIDALYNKRNKPINM